MSRYLVESLSWVVLLAAIGKGIGRLLAWPRRGDER